MDTSVVYSRLRQEIEKEKVLLQRFSPKIQILVEFGAKIDESKYPALFKLSSGPFIAL